ncbi:hypothetical protein HZC30_05145 [Candidatus Woesearchaeota archaeon]|nr:hypothetical protein [Candidatus Woesearchaeota archaeon]
MPRENNIFQREIRCHIPDSYDVDSGDIIAVIYPDGRSEVLCGYAVRRYNDEGYPVIACSLKEKDRFDEKLYNKTSCGYNIHRELTEQY